jgi:hypothetical protein
VIKKLLVLCVRFSLTIYRHTLTQHTNGTQPNQSSVIRRDRQGRFRRRHSRGTIVVLLEPGHRDRRLYGACCRGLTSGVGDAGYGGRRPNRQRQRGGSFLHRFALLSPGGIGAFFLIQVDDEYEMPPPWSCTMDEIGAEASENFQRPQTVTLGGVRTTELCAQSVTRMAWLVEMHIHPV